MIYVLTIIGALSLVCLAWFFAFKVQRSRIQSARKHITAETFAAEFSDQHYPREAIRTAYSDLAKLSGLPVCRADNLERTLGFLPEDFERMFEQRCRDLGLADVWKSPHAALLPLKTAEDYVRFLSAVMGEQRKLPPGWKG